MECCPKSDSERSVDDTSVSIVYPVRLCRVHLDSCDSFVERGRLSVDRMALDMQAIGRKLLAAVEQLRKLHPCFIQFLHSSSLNAANGHPKQSKHLCSSHLGRHRFGEATSRAYFRQHISD